MANELLDTRIMTVVGAIRAAIATSPEPGLSVNSHPNPFFLNVIGAINLRVIAENVLKRLDADHPVRAKADPETGASAVDGH